MRRFAVLLLSVVALGCSESNPLRLDPTSTNVAGTYNMLTADGIAPPFPAFYTETDQWHLLADTVVIHSDNTWEETSRYLVVSRADANVTSNKQTYVTGSYTIGNGQISFEMTSGGTDRFIGSVTGNSLTLIFRGKRFAYSR